MPSLLADDETAIALMAAIRVGEVETLAGLLEASTDAPSTWIIGPMGGSRSLLHIVTDWPGYFANGPAVARLLLDRGCDPSAACHGGGFAETPLHWAASSDDVDVAEVLIDGGADLEAPGGSIAGTPLANAVGYGCWHVARLLVARGAAITGLWQAAALGVLPRIEQMLAASRRQPTETSQRPSGRRVTAASVVLPNDCWPPAPISTGRPTTPIRHRWTSPARWTRARTCSPNGCARRARHQRHHEPVPP